MFEGTTDCGVKDKFAIVLSIRMRAENTNINRNETNPVEENNGFINGPKTSSRLPTICCAVPIKPLRSGLCSATGCSSLLSSSFRFPPFFFPTGFRLAPTEAPANFLRNSATRSLAEEVWPSLTPFSIAPLIQLLLDHSILYVIRTRVVEPPAQVRQYFVIT